VSVCFEQEPVLGRYDCGAGDVDADGISDDTRRVCRLGVEVRRRALMELD